eukprot:1161566-Pelagomonas_calceolata.AAC.2
MRPIQPGHRALSLVAHPLLISGVIWKGDKVIDGVPETLDLLRSLVGCNLYFPLCLHAAEECAFLHTGEEALLHYQQQYQISCWVLEKVPKPRAACASGGDILVILCSSSLLRVHQLPEKGGDNDTAYVVGEEGIQEELDLKGIKHLGGPADGSKSVNLKSGEYMHHDPEVSGGIARAPPEMWARNVMASWQRAGVEPACLSGVCATTQAVLEMADAWSSNATALG